MRCIEFTQYSALEREKWDINFVERIVDMMQRLILK